MFGAYGPNAGGRRVRKPDHDSETSDSDDSVDEDHLPSGSEDDEVDDPNVDTARVMRVELGAPHREAFVRRVLGQDLKKSVFFVSRVVSSPASFFVRLERLCHGLQVARRGASSRRLVLFGDERVVHGEVHRREVHGCQVQRAVLRERD